MTQAAEKVKEISVETAAEIAKCSRNTIRRLIESGSVDAWRLTPRSPWRVDRDSLQRYLDRARRNDH